MLALELTDRLKPGEWSAEHHADPESVFAVADDGVVSQARSLALSIAVASLAMARSANRRTLGRTVRSIV